MPAAADEQNESNPFPATSPLKSVADTLLARPAAPTLTVSLAGAAPFDAGAAAVLRALHGLSDVPANALALLHVLNDELAPAHVLVQAHENDATANYIHGIIHRREADWSNAKYWMRRAGTHPVQAALAKNNSPAGSPATFVDACQRGTETGENVSEAEQEQLRELRLLLAWCAQNPA